MSKKGKDLSNN